MIDKDRCPECNAVYSGKYCACPPEKMEARWKEEKEKFERQQKEVIDTDDTKDIEADDVAYIIDDDISQDSPEDDGSTAFVAAAKEQRAAAIQGDPDAMFNLGKHYLGEGLTQDNKLAQGLTQDNKKAVRNFENAANHGHVDAMFVLGMCYMSEIGVEQDLVIAYMWLSYAAGEGHKDAMNARDTVQKNMTSEQLEKSLNLLKVKQMAIEILLRNDVEF